MLNSLYRYTRSPLPVVVVKRRRRDAPQVSHSGAWKVAYADFVTAMMSLFLLLWLLNVTDTKQREAISSYFDPTAVSSAQNGANGLLGGKTVIEDGSKSSTDKVTGVQLPTPGAPDTSRRNDDQNNPGNQEKRTIADGAASDAKPTDDQAAAKLAAEHESLHFKEAEAALKQAIQAMPELQPLARNLIVDETPEGLRIQLVDQDGAAMFPLGSADPLDHTRKLLAIIPGVELVEIDVPRVGTQANSLAVLPAFKRELVARELAAVADAGGTTLATIYHACHRELCDAGDGRSFEVVNFMEILGEGLGLYAVDLYKRLKVIKEIDDIIVETSPLIAEHGLDLDTVHDALMQEFGVH